MSLRKSIQRSKAQKRVRNLRRKDFRLESLERRMLMAGDLAFAEGVNDGPLPLSSVESYDSVKYKEGNTIERVSQSVSIALEATDLQGNPLSNVVVDQPFLLRTTVEHTAGNGVFAGFVDVLYPHQQVEVEGPLQHSRYYSNGSSGSTKIAGLLDEVGGFSGLQPLGAGRYELFSVEMVAKTTGTLHFSTNSADNLPLHDVLIYDSSQPLSQNEINYGTLTIDAVPGVEGVDDFYHMDEDGGPMKLDVVSNDRYAGKSVRITSIESQNRVASFDVSEDGLHIMYEPNRDFHGKDTITYTIEDSYGTTDTADVHIDVKAVNDPPSVVDDAFSVPEDSFEFVLEVLKNDSFFPDEAETLTITSVTQPDQGGAIKISDDGTSLLYSPSADFFGEETLNYTVSDGKLESKGEVTITVDNVNDAPEANDDLILLDNYGDGVAMSLDVLSNDFSIDPMEELSVVSVMSSEADVDVRVSSDGSSIEYTPAAGFFGTRRLTYTVTDGNGLEDQATVLVMLDNPGQNDHCPLDVNADGHITPIDVLLVINELNSNGGGPLRRPVAGPYGPPFRDTNGDGYITPLDALLIINHLNSSEEHEPCDTSELEFALDHSLEVPQLGEKPISQIAGSSGESTNFVTNELLVTTNDMSVVNGVLERWNGELLKTIAPPAGTDLEATHVIRVDVSSADVTQMSDQLQQLQESAQGSYRVSDADGLQFLAVVASEMALGNKVSVNWLHEAATIAEGSTLEGETGPVAGYDRNSFTWPHMSDGSTQDIGVGAAWQAMERVGALENSVTIAIIDQGFAPSQDFPDGLIALAVDDDTDPLRTPGGDSPWHGTNALLSAMALPDNQFGGAGPAGPVATPMSIHDDLTMSGVMEALGMASDRGAQVVNMSFGWELMPPFGSTATALSDLTLELSSSMVIVASAGNSGKDLDAIDPATGQELIWRPMCEASGVICVGGLAEDSQNRDPGSNFGSDDAVDIYGPYSVWVAASPDNDGEVTGSGARRVRGTSFAAPFVAGVSGLIWAADPSLTASEVRSILLETANESPDATVDRYVNAAEAVFKALGMPSVDIISPVEGRSYSHRAASVPFIAQVDDAEDDTIPDSSIVWTSDRDGEIARGDYFETTRLSLGNHTITVTVTDSDGNEVSDTVQISIVNDAPIMTIDAPTGSLEACEGQEIHFRSTSRDLNNVPSLTLTDSQVAWYSNRDGFLGRGHDITADLSAGNHTITVRGSDGQLSDTATVNIHVDDCPDNPPVARIQTPSTDERHLFDGYDSTKRLWYKDVTLTGSATDAEDGTLSGSQLVWRTNHPGFAETVELNGERVLGTGRTITVRLYSSDAFGITHDVTLQAMDADGNLSSPILRRITLWTLA